MHAGQVTQKAQKQIMWGVPSGDTQVSGVVAFLKGKKAIPYISQLMLEKKMIQV